MVGAGAVLPSDARFGGHSVPQGLALQLALHFAYVHESGDEVTSASWVLRLMKRRILRRADRSDGSTTGGAGGEQAGTQAWSTTATAMAGPTRTGRPPGSGRAKRPSGGNPGRAGRRAAAGGRLPAVVREQHLEELLAALRLPNIWALFEAIGRDELPGSTADERTEIRHLAACVVLDALQVGGVPLPVAMPTPETLIRAAEDAVHDFG